MSQSTSYTKIYDVNIVPILIKFYLLLIWTTDVSK